MPREAFSVRATTVATAVRLLSARDTDLTEAPSVEVQYPTTLSLTVLPSVADWATPVLATDPVTVQLTVPVTDPVTDQVTVTDPVLWVTLETTGTDVATFPRVLSSK
uniref:Uncharacterized protein n=1 Tax=Cacopsylla melanoneura TaxID=428564 RepID=A0A8D9F881_9HEMI